MCMFVRKIKCLMFDCCCVSMPIAQPAGVHYNRDVSSLKAVSEQLAKTLITL